MIMRNTYFCYASEIRSLVKLKFIILKPANCYVTFSSVCSSVNVISRIVLLTSNKCLFSTCDTINLFHNYIALTKTWTFLTEKAGLKINIQKTKLLKVNSTQQAEVQLKGKDTEEDNKFTYLGSVVRD